jgi:hypothetical protein
MLATCIAPGDVEVDVVIKLNGAMDLGVRGAVFEIAGSLMARKLGLGCPTPYLVWMSTEFLEAVIKREPKRSTALRQSHGWNFGSEMLKDAATWPTAGKVTDAMLVDALTIFAFDGLIQNPDRSFANPNLLTKGDRLAVIDHESAFSFQLALLHSSSPWKLDPGDYMERHALRSSLREHDLDWQTCRASLQVLGVKFFAELRESIPTHWNAASDIDAIEQHVSQILDHLDEFEIELQRRIA